MRRAIAKQSRVRTIGNRRLPSQLKREGRALPGLHAVHSPPSGESRSAVDEDVVQSGL